MTRIAYPKAGRAIVHPQQQESSMGKSTAFKYRYELQQTGASRVELAQAYARREVQP